jgi:hypothetical protein
LQIKVCVTKLGDRNPPAPRIGPAAFEALDDRVRRLDRGAAIRRFQRLVISLGIQAVFGVPRL